MATRQTMTTMAMAPALIPEESSSSKAVVLVDEAVDVVFEVLFEVVGLVVDCVVTGLVVLLGFGLPDVFGGKVVVIFTAKMMCNESR